jgi:hypothetical protein
MEDFCVCYLPLFYVRFLCLLSSSFSSNHKSARQKSMYATKNLKEYCGGYLPLPWKSDVANCQFRYDSPFVTLNPKNHKLLLVPYEQLAGDFL